MTHQTNTSESTTIDLIMFMGQSNMAGRGITSPEHPESCPELIHGAGYEYRAITEPDRLSPMAEPFGKNENRTDGIMDKSKTGSMTVSFTNAYYLQNGGIPVVGVSASEGGTRIAQWQPGGRLLNDAVQRLTECISYLAEHNYTIRHKYILWCQGESDGDAGTSAADYKAMFDIMLAEMLRHGIEKLFMVRIGNYNSGESDRYDTIMNCQTDIAKTEPDVVMVSTAFAGMRAAGLMKDVFHYYQEGYNKAGSDAGIHAAYYATTGKAPEMLDTKDGTVYRSDKN